MRESMMLTDGRKLGFRELGDPNGKALFFFHGTPGSRLGVSEIDPIAQLPGIRLITPERPGYGLSTPMPHRVLLDWARDIAQLADHLNLRTFAVGGVSGGGPHALACAHALKDRVSVALVLSSPSPAGFRGATQGMSVGNRLGLLLQRIAPGMVRWMMRGNALAFEKNPEAFVDAIARQMSPSDRDILSNRAVRDVFIQDLREAYRQGGDGHALDGALAMTGRDWGFDLGEIAVPVYLWHGEQDGLAPKKMFQHLATSIPTCTAHSVPGAGHLLDGHAAVIEELGKALNEHAVSDQGHRDGP